MGRLFLWVLAGAGLAGPVAASTADLCRDAARQASADTGVPYDVLLAISQTETGRGSGGQVDPWPWTVNMEGEGHWFDDPQSALDYVRDRQAAGAISFDLGCFQLNHRWHGAAFASLEAMMDPAANARYAGEFLARLYSESGDWSVAAGAYHSRTETYATRYRARFDTFRAAAEPGGDAAPRLLAASTPALARTNDFPLLQGGSGAARLGSLVPLGSGG